MLELLKKYKIKLKLLSGRPKPQVSGDEDDQKYLQQLSDEDDVWDWTVFYNVQEIIIPPPDNIESGDIQWTDNMKDISEIPFTGPLPGFKAGMDLGPNASD